MGPRGVMGPGLGSGAMGSMVIGMLGVWIGDWVFGLGGWVSGLVVGCLDCYSEKIYRGLACDVGPLGPMGPRELQRTPGPQIPNSINIFKIFPSQPTIRSH